MTDLTPEQRRGVALALRGAQQLLGEIADDLMADRMTPEKWSELETTLDYLLNLVRQVSS